MSLAEQEINKLIDHTNLDLQASEKDIEKLVQEAQQHKFNSVCIRSKWAADFAKKYRCSVTIDFPKEPIFIGKAHDIRPATAKISKKPLSEKEKESRQALENGALELDPVISLKNLEAELMWELRSYVKVLEEHAINDPDQTYWLKPIFSCELLNPTRLDFCIKTYSNIVNKFLENGTCQNIKFAFKNSTGFVKLKDGADESLKTFFTSPELIEIITTYLDKHDPEKHIKIKAAGGIKKLTTIERIAKASNERLSHIGTSSGLEIMAEPSYN